MVLQATYFCSLSLFRKKLCEDRKRILLYIDGKFPDVNERMEEVARFVLEFHGQQADNVDNGNESDESDELNGYASDLSCSEYGNSPQIQGVFNSPVY